MVVNVGKRLVVFLVTFSVLSGIYATSEAAALLLPPKAPWALAVLELGGSFDQWQVYTWGTNVSLVVITSSHWIMLRLNESVTLDLNNSSRVFDSGRSNVTIRNALVISYEGNNTRRIVKVQFGSPSQGNPATTLKPGEPSWTKYWWALLAALASALIGIPAGKEIKERHMRKAWVEAVRTKAISLEEFLGHEQNQGKEDRG